MLINCLKYLGVVLLFTACSNDDVDLRSRDRSHEALEVEAFVAQKQNWIHTIESSGTLLPYKEIFLKSEVNGKVVKVNFKEGEKVQKGQVLVQVDDQVLSAQKDQLEVQLKWLKKQVDRNEKLWESEAISEEALEQSISEMEEVEAQLTEINAQINLTTIHAPFEGKVGLTDIEVGSYLNIGDEIVPLTVSQPLKLEFSIPEMYADHVEIDQSVAFKIMDSMDTLTAQIYAHENRIDRATRMLSVRAIYENKDRYITPGTYADVFFTVSNEKGAILIPSEAIEPQLSGEIVYLVKNGEVQIQKITTGKRNESMVQVVKGINPNDTLLVTGLLAAREGTQVSIQKIIRK